MLYFVEYPTDDILEKGNTFMDGTHSVNEHSNILPTPKGQHIKHGNGQPIVHSNSNDSSETHIINPRRAMD